MKYYSRRRRLPIRRVRRSFRSRPYTRRRRTFRRKGFLRPNNPARTLTLTRARKPKSQRDTTEYLLTNYVWGVLFSVDIANDLNSGSGYGQRRVLSNEVSLTGYSVNYQIANKTLIPIVFHMAIVMDRWGTTASGDLVKQFFSDPQGNDLAAVDFLTTNITANPNLQNVYPLSSKHWVVLYHKKFMLQARNDATSVDAGRSGTEHYGLSARNGRFYVKLNQRIWINTPQANKQCSVQFLQWFAPLFGLSGAPLAAGVDTSFQTRTYFRFQ